MTIHSRERERERDWKEVHENFGKEWYNGITYQQLWEKGGLAYQDAQEWTKIKFEPSDIYEIEIWKSHSFTPQEVKSWIDIGLTKYDAKFVAYLKLKNNQPQSNLDLEELGAKFATWLEKSRSAQSYLDIVYPKEQRNTIKKMYFNQKNLTGSLDLNDFVSLEELYCSSNQLTSLKLDNCLKLKKIYCGKNYLTELNINHLTGLAGLNCHSNQLTSLDLSNCSSLIKLDCGNNWLINLILPKIISNLEAINLNKNSLRQDLAFLQGATSLENLYLRNNKFYGSLEHLSYMRKLKRLVVSNTNINSGLEYLPGSVKKFRYSVVNTRRDVKCQIIYDLFADIEENRHVKDSSQKIQKIKQKIEQWKKLNFTSEETWEWINSGVGIDDYKFINWLKNTKNLTPKWITSYKEDYQILSERFKKYGLCPECNQPNTGENWCQSCNAKRFQQNFKKNWYDNFLPNKWTSQNQEIDKFIQKYQLEATEASKFIEWIPYEQFKDIEYLAEGGFGKVYKAKWSEGNISHWDTKKKQWKRGKDNNKIYREVVLKSLNNSSENTDFLDETEKHKIIDDWFNNIAPCYGLSQDPKTSNYLMIMQYMPEGNLRNCLSNKNKELTLQVKLSQLFHIAQGLKDIHAKNLVHRDFHSGNILKGIEKTSCLITDLGLCKPVNEASQEKKVFGVMPYVAPEVLRGKPYTQKADIYSFGIIAYEVLSGLPPYYDKKHDEFLGMKICQGLRPQFRIKIPQLLEDLIKRCWDADLTKRPTAYELERILRGWEKDLEKDQKEEFKHKEREFTQQFQATETHNETLLEGIKFPKYEIHYGAVYHSRLLPTKEITKLLSQPQGTITTEYSDSLAMDFTSFNLEENQQTEQQAQIIQLPYGTPESSK